MQNAVVALANDIRRLDGNHNMGAGALAEALVQLGWVKVRKLAHPPLAAYDQGQGVMVLNREMSWVEGTVTEKSVGLLIVSYDGGQATIGSPNRISPFRAGDDV